MAFDPSLMPFVSSMTSSSLFGESHACPMKATFPCVKSIFEGRVATTGTSLQDFSAVASQRTTWPDSLAKLGKRLVVASDHTLNRLYPGAFVDSLNYEDLTVPLFDRDKIAYEHTDKWLSDPSIDVLLLHIIGTDKVAHQYPVRGPEYRAKYLEVDNFVRSVAARLSPNDYIYVVGDHGHNDQGGHTENAAYIANGPIFPKGRQQNLDASDMLFLLSIPYGLTLPDEYEGQVRTDLTVLPDDLREQWLRAQAKRWGVASEGVAATALEARLNERIIRNRDQEQRHDAIRMAQRVAPWILAAALFLIARLKPAIPRRALDLPAAALLGFGIVLGLAGISFAGWIALLGALLLCAGHTGMARTSAALCLLAALLALQFWLLPSRAGWFHNMSNQPTGWLLFYPLAALAGIIFSMASEPKSWGRRTTDILWTVGIGLWLLSYAGPYKYALVGRGPIIILLILAPLAICAINWRIMLSFWTLCWIGLLPFIVFHTESYNINYLLLDHLAALPLLISMTICLVAALAWLIVFGFSQVRSVRWPWAILFVAIWIFAGVALFQFEAGKLTGALLGGVWLAGCLELFRRAQLSATWSALVTAILLFAVFYFALNGFTLSHVDFRFASEKIIPFQQEALRAPQLIAWVMFKYLFILLPALAVAFSAPEKSRIARYIAQLGWWRELTLVVATLGLSLFDKGGLSELCGEEIYFWTFLNIILWLFAVISAWNSPERTNEAENAAAAGTYPA